MDVTSIFAKLKRGAKFDHKKHKNGPNRGDMTQKSAITSSQSNHVTNNSSEKKRKREENSESYDDGSNVDDFVNNEVEQEVTEESSADNDNDNKINHIENESGIVIRKKNKIKVFGSDVPDPVVSFQELKDT